VSADRLDTLTAQLPPPEPEGILVAQGLLKPAPDEFAHGETTERTAMCAQAAL
jgi:hypothetical protein